MQTPSNGEVTQLLKRLQSGDATSQQHLYELVYGELRRIAAKYMRGERSDHTLQATELVHEAYFRLVGRKNRVWSDRVHFFAVAAQIMRSILVDHARSHRAQKRGGCKPLRLSQTIEIGAEPVEYLIELDQALDRLATWDPRQARVVELRFFAGLKETEIAELLGVAERTVKRDWSMAKAWLHAELFPDQRSV